MSEQTTDRVIACVLCGGDFPFTAEEQAFYAEKGFQEPRKCKPCRQASKSQRQGFQEKRFFDTVCSACGVQTQVPFVPKGDRPVYCRECYRDVGQQNQLQPAY